MKKANQAAGTIPSKVSVPFPQNATKPAPSGAAKPKAPAGFTTSVIPGKI